MNYTIYDNSTGQIVSNGTIRDDMAEKSLRGQNWIDGTYSGKDYYIESGQPVRIPLEPVSPFKKYTFNYGNKMWEVDLVATERLIRQMRQSALSVVDKMNPIWYAELSEEKKQELRDYRQAWLDITDVESFPIITTVPTRPSWL
jgi:hypothetical protein